MSLTSCSGEAWFTTTLLPLFLLIIQIPVWSLGWSLCILARITPLWYPEQYSGDRSVSYQHVGRNMEVTQPPPRCDGIITRNGTLLAPEDHKIAFHRSELWRALLLLSTYFVYILSTAWQWLKSTIQTVLTDQVVVCKGSFHTKQRMWFLILCRKGVPLRK